MKWLPIISLLNAPIKASAVRAGGRADRQTQMQIAGVAAQNVFICCVTKKKKVMNTNTPDLKI